MSDRSPEMDGITGLEGFMEPVQPPAERAGFEPAMGREPHTRLAGECLQPLGHLSVREGLSLEARRLSSATHLARARGPTRVAPITSAERTVSSCDASQPSGHPTEAGRCRRRNANPQPSLDRLIELLMDPRGHRARASATRLSAPNE